MASKIKEEILNELLTASEVTDPGTTQYKILETLYNNIDKLDDDKDIQNLIWVNRELPLRMFTNEHFKVMPNIAGILTGNADTDTIDLDKDFGEDWYKEYEQIPVSKIQFIADKYGRNANDLINYMQKEAVNRRRQEIADDLLAKLAAPRSTEAIQRGESPSNKDIAIDVAQNAAYAIPWARGAQAVTKGAGRLYKVLSNPFVQGTLSNVTAPLATEVADAATYDESNPRGNFNVGDVAAGAGVNLVGGSLIRGAGAGIHRISPTVGRYLNTFGQGKTPSEVTDDLMKDYIGWKSFAAANNPAISAEARNKAQQMKQLAKSDYDKFIAISLKEKAPIWQIGRQEGKTFEEKLNKYLLSQDEYAPLLDEYIATDKSAAINKLLSAYDKLGLGRTELYPGSEAKSAAKLLGQEALKNYVTNQFGSYKDEQGKALTRIPIIGLRLQKYFDDKAKEEAEQRKLEELMRKYYINLDLGVK